MKKILFIAFVLILTACHSNQNKDSHLDIPDQNAGPKSREVNVKIMRFDKDILAMVKDTSTKIIDTLRKRYGSFLDTTYCMQIMRMRMSNDRDLRHHLTDFLTDSDVKAIYKEVDKTFPDLTDYEKDFSAAFTRFVKYFPDRNEPRIYTMISAFNYAVVSTDSAMVLGLDMFLGTDHIFYSSMGFPKYKINRMRKEYLVPQLIEGWMRSEFDGSNTGNDLISQMVYNGKIYYCLDALLPTMDDTLKIGYTGKQMEWCKASEPSIWKYFIEHDLLFTADELKYAKFVTDGPTSNGMPKESPGNIGSWTGWQIVRKYMREHPDITVKQLMENNDAQKILSESKYKPEDSGT